MYVVYVSVGLVLGLTSYHLGSQHHMDMKRSMTEASTNCTTSNQCGHGKCVPDGPGLYVCQCEVGWIDHDGICNYQQRSKLDAFLISLLVGELGIDWFYLAYGNRIYVLAGIFKLMTIGCVGIWWIIDWIRILADGFLDGNGVVLQPW